MTKYYEILTFEAQKEVCGINSKSSAKAYFYEKIEKNLSGQTNFESGLTRETSFQKSEPNELSKICNNRANSQAFSCPSCSFTNAWSGRVAEHFMSKHEQKFPYRKRSIFLEIVVHNIFKISTNRPRRRKCATVDDSQSQCCISVNHLT